MKEFNMYGDSIQSSSSKIIHSQKGKGLITAEDYVELAGLDIDIYVRNSEESLINLLELQDQNRKRS